MLVNHFPEGRLALESLSYGCSSHVYKIADLEDFLNLQLLPRLILLHLLDLQYEITMDH